MRCRALWLAIGLGMACGDDSDQQGYCEACTLDVQTELIAGPGAENCGAVEPEADPSAVHNCLQFAAGDSAAFGEYRAQGIDSTVLTRWIVDAEGNVHRMSYDSNICGGAGGCDDQCGPRISVTPCGAAMDSPGGADDPFLCDSGEAVTVCEPPSVVGG